MGKEFLKTLSLTKAHDVVKALHTHSFQDAWRDETLNFLLYFRTQQRQKLKIYKGYILFYVETSVKGID